MLFSSIRHLSRLSSCSPVSTSTSALIIILSASITSSAATLRFPTLTQSTNRVCNRSPPSSLWSPLFSNRQFSCSAMSSENIPKIDVIVPTKSEEDEREYRVITLPNKMRVMLVSDPEADKAAAAMDVHVGHFSDPDDIPGLAHFCEHMLFLGTEKYPDENDYSSYLSEHGGHSNAWTDKEHTNYYFDVMHRHLEPALDRFAQFFVAPLFTESSTDREMNAVHSENAKNLLVDAWRLSQLTKTPARSDHPFSKFGTGNLETLSTVPKQNGVDVRDALIAFHGEHYSANAMRLSVIAREPLDQLQEWVTEKFAHVRNTDRAMPRFGTDPLAAERQLGWRYDIVPIKDLRTLKMLWPTETVIPRYLQKPDRILSHLIGHEGPGSIFAVLKEKGWANSLSAGMHQSATSFGLFGVTVGLTEDGLLHVNDITRIIYEYIGLIAAADSETLERLWSEESNVAAMDFRFKGKEAPSSYVSSLASALHKFPPEHALTGPWLFAEFDESMVRSMLSAFTPSNMMMHVVSHSFRDVADQKERWYGTEFRSYRIPSDDIDLFLHACSGASVDNADGLHLPDENPFIATDFALRATPASRGDRIAPTELCDYKEVDRIELWHKLDNVFRKPKLIVKLRFHSALTTASPRNSALTHQYIRLVKDALNDYAYFAEISGLHYSLAVTSTGFTLSFSGYSHKLPVLMTKVLECMRTLTVDDARFELIREQYERSLCNFNMEQPYYHCMYHQNVLTETLLWYLPETLSAVRKITAEDVRAFFPRLLGNLRVQCLVHGNADADEAAKLAAQVQQKLRYENLSDSLVPARRLVRLEENTHYHMSRDAPNEDESNSALLSHYQVGPAAVHVQAGCALLAHILNEPCFDQLRTKEQIGYLVFSQASIQYGVIGFNIILQSSCRTVEYMEGRVEAFLVQFRASLVDMDTDAFLANRDAVIARKLEKNKRMSQECSQHWAEIQDHRYDFDRRLHEVDELRKIELSDIVALFDRYLRVNSPHRCKLSTSIVGHSKSVEEASVEEASVEEASADGKLSDPPVDNAKLVEVRDITKFRRSSYLYPDIL